MLKGIGLKIGATFAFALMSGLIKAAAPVFPGSEVVFFRSIFATATLAGWLAARGEWPAALRTTRPLGHIGRSLAGSCGMFANFLALALLPLADATAFTFATPLMVVPLAAIVLGEEVGTSGTPDSIGAPSSQSLRKERNCSIFRTLPSMIPTISLTRPARWAWKA